MKNTTVKIPEKPSIERGRPRLDDSPVLATRLQRILAMVLYGYISTKERAKGGGCSIRSFEQYVEAFKEPQLDMENILN